METHVSWASVPLPCAVPVMMYRFPGYKNYHFPVCTSLVHILKTTQSLTFQFSNKVWQSLFCKQL